MTISTFAASGTQTTLAPVDYQPGVCNIGPAEIARRRRAGHIGLVAALALFAVLVAIDAPNWTRLLIAIPAIMARPRATSRPASSSVPASVRAASSTSARSDPRNGWRTMRIGHAIVRRARQIGAASIAIGLAAGLIAAVLPI